MIPASDPATLAERTAWFDTAFRGVCKPAAERLRGELDAHYDHVFQQSMSAGASEWDAHRAGMAALGNAKAARKSFRAKYLTEWQNRRLERDGAFNSPPYSRLMDMHWGLLLLACASTVGLALRSPNLSFAGVSTLVAFLMTSVALVVISLRGKAPRGDYLWVILFVFGCLGIFGTCGFLYLLAQDIQLGRWPHYQIAGTYEYLLLGTQLGVQLLYAAFILFVVCLHIGHIKKARNMGLIGPKRSKGIQPN